MIQSSFNFRGVCQKNISVFKEKFQHLSFFNVFQFRTEYSTSKLIKLLKIKVYIKVILHGDGAPNGGSIPSECCNQKGCGHLPAACRRRSDVAGLGECLLCPGF